MKRLRFLALLTAGFCAAAPAAYGADPVKIGVILPLSGRVAVIGKHIKAGMETAAKALGGKMAGRPIEMMFGDSQAKPQIGKQLAEKYVNSDKVDFVVGTAFSHVLMAIQGTVTRSKTFLLSPNAGPAPLAGARCSPYFFVVSFQNDQTAEAMGEYANQAGKKNVFILAPNYQAGKDILAGFKRTFKGKIVEELYTPLRQTDFSAELSAIRSKKPDAVFVFYPGGLGVQFVKQWAQSGLGKTIPLYSNFTVDQATLPALKGAATGVLSSSQWALNLDNPANKAFVKAFVAQHKFLPAAYAAQGYDTVMLIDSAVRAVKGNLKDKDAVRAALKKADFKSVRGAFAFNTNQYPIHDIYVRKTVKDGQGRYVAAVNKVAVKGAKDSYYTQCKMK